MLTLSLAVACAPTDDVADAARQAAADAVLVGWHHKDSGYPEPGSGGSGMGRCCYLVDGFAPAVDYSVAASESTGVVGEDHEHPEPKVVAAWGKRVAREVVVLSEAAPLEIEVVYPPDPSEEWTWTVEAGNRDGVWWVESNVSLGNQTESPLVPGCPVDDAVEPYELSLTYWYPDS